MERGPGDESSKEMREAVQAKECTGGNDGLRVRVVLFPFSAEGDRRSAVEVAQFTIRQNRETLAKLKREQKEVKNELKKRNALARDDGSKSNVEKEIVELEKRVHTLRRTHDKLCQNRRRCVGKLAGIQDGIKDLERGSTKSISSPIQKNLRTVENRLDKVGSRKQV